MRKLYHLALYPSCRFIRLLLNEKGLDYELVVEKIWERRADFLAVNPAGEVPVLHESDGTMLSHAWVIAEYLEEVFPEHNLLGFEAIDRAEIRRLLFWFEQKFAQEVSQGLVNEKIMKRFLRMGQPRSDIIRACHQNLHYHLDYISYLSEQRKWLGGDFLSLADLAAAAHISVVDYLGDVPWEKHGEAKNWYARMKSRPAFRPLLQDMMPGLPPPKHYADPDF